MPPTLLVVDDDPAMRTLLGATLTAEGFDVRATGDTEAVPELVREMRPDVVLLDWVMPGSGGGPAVCRRICAATGAPPVVIHTGLADPRDATVARHAGAAAFLRKGIEPAHLAAELRRAMGTVAADV